MEALDGNSAIAEAIKQIEPDVVVSYPQSPSILILEAIALFIANGEMDSEFLNVESDYSAMSTCIGVASSGGRVFTATASQGLALMHEALFIASSLRLPIVIGVTNRTLAAPINFNADHSDSMAQRDSGWIQIFSENSQEAYDNIIQAFKIAENKDVRTPVMVGIDSVVTSNLCENIHIQKNEEILEFENKSNPTYSVLDIENPKTVGSLCASDYFFEHKMNQNNGIENSRKVIKNVGKEFGDRFNRYYGYFETYELEDAEYAVILMSSSAGTAKKAVDEMRKRGENVGLLKLRVFRPFPYKELRESLSNLKSIAVLDRVLTPGTYGGPLFIETMAALYNLDKRPLVYPYIYGLGGRDITLKHIENIFDDMKMAFDNGKGIPEIKYINLRE